LEFAEEHNELTDGKKKKRDPEGMTADEALKRAAEIQDEDLDNLDGMIQMVENTKQIGADTAAELQAQTDKLRQASEHVKEIESNMDIAQAELRSFIRRMGTDKLFMVCLCVVVIGIIVAVVWSIIAEETDKPPDQFGNETDASKA
jgi:t-SNARE complex subunit (syntaxin)